MILSPSESFATFHIFKHLLLVPQSYFPYTQVMATSNTHRHINSYTVEFKILVVDWLRRNDRNVSKTAREFEIDRKRVREWDNNYAKLLENKTGQSAKKRKIGCGRKPLSFDLDVKLFEFLEEERSEGRPVSNEILRLRALQIAGGLQIERTFTASAGWIARWKERFGVGIRCGTNSSQYVPADYADKLMTFRKAVISIRKTKSISQSNIINMDQTMCRFDMPPSRTNSKKGEKTVRIKTTRAEKKGFTVALAATADGQKLPAVIIFKERGGVFGVRVRSKLKVPTNVRVRASMNGWMTAPEYHHWLTAIFKKQEEPRLLIVDSYRAHVTKESVDMAKDECNAELVIIPGGCTSVVQPMDKCINRPFKQRVREHWQEWMRQDRPKTPSGNLKQPTRQDVIDWVSEAWTSIKKDTLVHSFLVCGISNALDGSQDDLVSSDLPNIEDEGDESEGAVIIDEEDSSDVDSMGDPFGDDED